MDLKLLLLACVCLYLTISSSSGQQYQDCNIDRFRVQQNLNVTRFSGHWYGISANREFNPVSVNMGSGMGMGGGGGGWGMFSGFNAGMPRRSPWANMRPIRNLQYHFEILQDSNATMKTLSSGSVVGNRCFYAQGVNTPHNISLPAKTDFLFQGNTFPIWVISTDYEGYAVIYSCWNTDVNGACTPDSSYVISLNRVMEGHTTEELRKVEAASSYVCVQHDLLRPVVHDGGCYFNTSDFPLEEFTITNDINLNTNNNNFFPMI